jgi:hypothetical protein
MNPRVKQCFLCGALFCAATPLEALGVFKGFFAVLMGIYSSFYSWHGIRLKAGIIVFQCLHGHVESAGFCSVAVGLRILAGTVVVHRHAATNDLAVLGYPYSFGEAFCGHVVINSMELSLLYLFEDGNTLFIDNKNPAGTLAAGGIWGNYDFPRDDGKYWFMLLIFP